MIWTFIIPDVLKLLFGIFGSIGLCGALVYILEGSKRIFVDFKRNKLMLFLFILAILTPIISYFISLYFLLGPEKTTNMIV